MSRKPLEQTLTKLKENLIKVLDLFDVFCNDECSYFDKNGERFYRNTVHSS